MRNWLPILWHLRKCTLSIIDLHDIWTEVSSGTLARAMRIHGGTTALFAGKVVAGTALIALVAWFSLVAGAVLFGVAPVRVPLAWFWATVSGGALMALFQWLQVLARTRRAAVIVGHLLMFPLLILGGSLFPTEAMPKALAAAGRWTPNGWALAHLKAIFAGRAGVVETLVPMLALIAFAIVCTALGVRRVSARFGGA